MIYSAEAQPLAFNLAAPVTFELETQLKTKTKVETKTLEHGHIYTPDVLVLFTPAMRPFVNIVGHPTTPEKRHLPWCHEDGELLKCWVEVKPDGYDKHNMLRLAKINQKWVFNQFGKMINIIKIGNKRSSFFAQTFCPQRYLKCDRAIDRARKINFTPLKVGDFLQKG